MSSNKDEAALRREKSHRSRGQEMIVSPGISEIGLPATGNTSHLCGHPALFCVLDPPPLCVHGLLMLVLNWDWNMAQPLLFSSSHSVTTVFTAPSQVSDSQEQHLMGSAHLLESILTSRWTLTPPGPLNPSVDVTSSDKPSLLQPPGQAGVPPMSSHCLRTYCPVTALERLSSH